MSAPALQRIDPVRQTSHVAPPYDLIELMFFAYRDFVGEADLVLAAYGLRTRASSGLAFRRPSARPHHRRTPRHLAHHQAEPQPGVARPHRRGVHRAARRRLRSPAAAARDHAQRRGAGARARPRAERPYRAGARRGRRGHARGGDALSRRRWSAKATARMCSSSWRAGASTDRIFESFARARKVRAAHDDDLSCRSRRRDGDAKPLDDHSPHVLVVDDDTRIRTLLSRYLSR